MSPVTLVEVADFNLGNPKVAKVFFWHFCTLYRLKELGSDVVLILLVIIVFLSFIHMVYDLSLHAAATVGYRYQCAASSVAPYGTSTSTVPLAIQ